MRTNRIARQITLAAALLGSGIAPSILAQAPGGPSQVPPSQSPAATPSAAAPADKPEEPPTEAELTIDEAIKKVAAVKAVSADLVQDVKMLGQTFQIKGRYAKAPAARIYMKLDVVGLPGSTGTMLQVSNGEVLWDYQKIFDNRSYRKLSVKPILERLQAPEIDKDLREQIMSSLGFVGPEALLVGVRKSIRFDQKEEGELDDKAVWIVRGGWRDRTGLTGPDQRPVPAIGKLPPFVPSLAALYLDKETGWPYKLDLTGRPDSAVIDTRQIGLDGQRIGSKSSIERQAPSSIRLVYSNIQFDPPLTAADFAFQAPPDADVVDNTDVLLGSLNKAIEFQAQRKSIEAANAAGDVLKQPIEVPAPSPAPETPK